MSSALSDLPAPTSIKALSATSLSRRRFLAGVGALATGLTIDATLIARHTYEVVDRTLHIRNLPEAFHGYRIVQLSDIHLDEYTEPAFLTLILHRINLLAPDLVLLTGDFASRSPWLNNYSRNAVLRCADLLRALACPLRYAILGNHDVGIGSNFVVHALTSAGTPVLVNRHVPIERGGHHLWLGGIDDPGTGHPILDLAVPRFPDAPVLLMCHAPDYADDIIRHPRGSLVDLMLAGHSHGGQVRLPFVGPLSLPPLGNKYVEGLFRFNTMQLYVNRGIGTVGLPIRLNCPPEITHITLQPASPA